MNYTEIFFWGTDTAGQCGFGEELVGKTSCIPRSASFDIIILEISCGDEHTALIDRSFRVFTMGSNVAGKLGVSDKNLKNAPWPVLVESLLDYQILHISCGFSHSAAVCQNGNLFT